MIDAGALATATRIPGVTVRPLRVPDDYRPMNVIANAVRAADGLDWATSDDQFQFFYEHLTNCDPARDVVIAERDGRMVGYGRASWEEEEAGGRVYYPIAFIDPAATDREALAGGLIDVMEARIKEIAGGHPPGPRRLRLEVGASAHHLETILGARGYRPVRWEHVMVRPTLDDLPDAPMPDGLEIREVRPEHLPAIWEAAVEAFADSWGAAAKTEQDYERFATDPVEGDTTLWRIAWEGDQVAGMVRGYINADENEQYGRRRGYVEHISVRKPWRRRGLARALIAATFPLLRARGMTEGALGVDTQNADNALRLYESCGFVVVKTISVWERPLE